VPLVDIFTLEIFTTLNMLLAGTAMFLVWTVNRHTSGVRRCAFACLIFLIGFATFPARLVIPGKPSILIPNYLIFAGMLVLLDGVRAFRGLRRPRGWYVAGSAVYAFLLFFWTYMRDDINARTIVEMVAVVVVAWSLIAAMITNVAEKDRYIYWATAAGMGLHGLAAFIKGCDAIWGPTILFWSPRPVDILFSATLNVCIIGCAFGLSMAINLKLQRETEVLARYDPLTQLPNRRHFEEILERFEQRAFEAGERLALVYCDLDDFKGINDMLGHEGGDMALRLVGERLRKVVDKNVCLARVGGDEFLLLIEKVSSREKVHGLIKRLASAVEGPIEFEGQTVMLKISCGLAIYPDDVGSVSDLIRLADAAMYMVKQHGRAAPLSAAARA
jgi:diguanylate cyclase (GGDEF)-like protein